MLVTFSRMPLPKSSSYLRHFSDPNDSCLLCGCVCFGFPLSCLDSSVYNQSSKPLPKRLPAVVRPSHVLHHTLYAYTHMLHTHTPAMGGPVLLLFKDFAKRDSSACTKRRR